MKFHVGMCLEPILVLLVGVEVVEDDVKLLVRKDRGDAVHEVEKLDTATAFRMRRNDLSGGDFQANSVVVPCRLWSTFPSLSVMPIKRH
jgi:hypothetical protein